METTQFSSSLHGFYFLTIVPNCLKYQYMFYCCFKADFNPAVVACYGKSGNTWVLKQFYKRQKSRKGDSKETDGSYTGRAAIKVPDDHTDGRGSGVCRCVAVNGLYHQAVGSRGAHSECVGYFDCTGASIDGKVRVSVSTCIRTSYILF